MENFDITPSFYNSDEVFKKYLGETSYYKKLQHAISKIIKIVKPKEIIEFGFGTGETSLMLAKENPNIFIKAIDKRTNMVTIAKKKAKLLNTKNIHFSKGEMVEYVNQEGYLPDFVLLLYSFHHIEDPLEKKIDFLKKAKIKLPKNGRICIAETFLPEGNNELQLEDLTKQLWSERIKEGYASTFWASLTNLSEEGIKKSKKIGQFSADYEAKAGNLVIKRDNEYLIKLSWLKETAEELGYLIELAEPCNSHGEYVVILKNYKDI